MAVDPRLNSVHLEPPRRQEFRRAREALLNARGWPTLNVEIQQDDESEASPHTVIEPPEPATDKVQFWLRDRDTIYPLRVGLNTVGRSSDNDVVLADSYVSRRHCAILIHTSSVCELHDTASKNGTYLNGERLAGPTRLASGDEIRMCDCQLIFLTKDEPARPKDPTATQTD